jgi:hypothetical protein
MKYMLLLVLLLPFTSEADCGHGNNPCEVPGPQGEQGPKGDKGDKGDPGNSGVAGVAGANGQNGLDGDSIETNLLSGYADEDYVDGVTAGFMAVSQIDFSSSTSAWQVGVGVGYYESENAIAIGVGKLLPDHDILLKGTITNINSENAYGAGLMWKLQ